MKKLIGLYRSLPREVQMLIAMAGLGTPLGMIYVLQRFLFPGMPMFFVILIVGGVVLGICLLGYLISRIFGRGKRKRNKKLAADLAADAEGGMASVDVRAAIKSNNEKFFTAIREMRKGLGISIYDLPWYIVLGDSGCGKTKLINEGGLTFSTGKPEGYQLGTLNYNWWFTEDAIFVDMAGRLCNPKDDADRKEWEAFLGTIGKGRKGYPINGALVCVSADHLLADPPEKIEQDANTILERLRDLQNKLGVTFATYLIITKCDKIVGFMQFFDRAERDITVKNQMFGISREGEFNELYDPEGFSPHFDVLYGRLNQLRLRRMNDESDEGDLGLAYSFPEEFRELREPLQTYIRTLFPMIKNPRAVKNLIYRGTYFTSATQEGQLILKHLTERLGDEAAGQFQSLDLYPNKRPHFIKDVLFRKVFPEHGLVFRNEQEAVKKRKWAKRLKVASIVLAVGLVATFAASVVKFNGVIGTPRADAKRLTPQQETTPVDALVLAGDLRTDIKSLEENHFWAFLLSFGVGTNKPIDGLKVIQAGIFERVLLRQVLLDVGKALRETNPSQLSLDEEGYRQGDAYLAALEQYIIWAGCAGEENPPEHLTVDGLKAMCAVVTDPAAFVQSNGEQFWSQAANYFNVISEEGGNWRNPARVLRDPAHDPDGTVKQAVGRAHEYLRRYAELTDQHPDPVVREWMRLHDQCVAVQETYAEMLDAADADPQTREELTEFKDGFVASFDRFDQALAGCTWQGKPSGTYLKIKSLREAILGQREVWIGLEEKFNAAYALCPSAPQSTIPASIQALRGGSSATGLPGLDGVLWSSLQDARLTEKDYFPQNYEEFQNLVQEVPDEYAHLITLIDGANTSDDKIELAEAPGMIRELLQKMRDKLVAAPLDASSGAGSPAEWTDALFAILEEADEELESNVDVDKFDELWRPEDLEDLDVTHQILISRGVATQLLATIDNSLADIGSWGFAELQSDDDFLSKTPSSYRIPIPTRGEDRTRSGRGGSDEEDEPKRTRKRPRRTTRRSSGRRPSRSSEDSDRGGWMIPNCATQSFLLDQAQECADLKIALGDFEESLYFPGESDDMPLHESCMDRLEQAAQTYMQAYVLAWGNAYKAKNLRDLDKMLDRARDWPALAKMMRRNAEGSGVNRDDVGDELRDALAEILSAVPFWDTYKDDNGEWVPLNLNEDGWQDVGDWMNEAIDSWWPSDMGSFAFQARLPESVQGARPGDAPADLLADEFRLRWRELANGIGDNAELPDNFEQEVRRRDQRGIPWGEIDKLRQESRLEDEKLTGKLVAFEHQAQALLSEELTDLLCGVQSRYFGSQRPFDGWPYLNSSGTEHNALDTVEFDGFKDFLFEVANARKLFEPIEESLPEDDELGRERDAFYRSCEKWFNFLDLNDSRVANELTVEVAGDDPIRPPLGKEHVDDTAQHEYEFIELDLGLSVPTGGQTGADATRALRVATSYEQKVLSHTCVWRWATRTDGTELSVALVSGFQVKGASMTYPAIKKVVGESSPLALCAYLHRYAVKEDGKWYTSHGFDLAEEFKRSGHSDLVPGLKTGRTVLGEKFVFSLERRLPDPIEKLQTGRATARRNR